MIDSLSEFTPRALGELKQWLTPWFLPRGTTLPTGTNGQRLELVAGAAKWVTASSVRVYNSIAQSVANTGTTTITFDSETFDNDAMHSTSTNTSRLTCVTAGIYWIAGIVVYASNATGTLRGAQINLNGALTGYTSLPPIAGNSLPVAISTLVQLAVGDYVELLAYQDATGAINTVATSGGTQFSAFRVSA